MSVDQRGRLIARIRQLRRVAAATEARSPTGTRPDPPRLQALEDRVAHLERLLEGLQDSVHRASERQDKRIAELEARVQPAAMGAALSKDARERGL